MVTYRDATHIKKQFNYDDSDVCGIKPDITKTNSNKKFDKLSWKLFC